MTEPAGRPTSRKAGRWRRNPSPEEVEQAKQAWRDAVPWDHPMSRGDKLLVFSTLGLLAFMLVPIPLRPLLLASHPVALSAVTGSTTAIGAGAAFARTGVGELWVVIVAGVFGKIKFDWLFWLAGRRWGGRIIAMWAPGEVAARIVARVRAWPSWALPLVVVLAVLPGVPAAAVFATAGLAGMRLVRFLVADAIGALALVGLVAGLGYGVGQQAVDVVLLIDRYALWISLALVVVVAFRVARRGGRTAPTDGR